MSTLHSSIKSTLKYQCFFIISKTKCYPFLTAYNALHDFSCQAQVLERVQMNTMQFSRSWWNSSNTPPFLYPCSCYFLCNTFLECWLWLNCIDLISQESIKTHSLKKYDWRRKLEKGSELGRTLWNAKFKCQLGDNKPSKISKI